MPLSGPDDVEGRVVTAETLLSGDTPDGRNPDHRRILAEGLARQIALLGTSPDLSDRTGPGPSWSRYQGGPWPVPHDTLVDFNSTPVGYEWLDQLGQRAADQILSHRDTSPVVVGHADWYGGNTVCVDGALAGVFDWQLVADTEAVIAGFAAACYGARSTGSGGLSSPEEVAVFLRDYETARETPFSPDEQRTAAGAAAWILAFNARWQVALIELDLADYGTVTMVRDAQEAYLALSW